MKKLIIVLTITLTACGGDVYVLEEKDDWEIDVELCEAQDGISELNHVTDPITGSYSIEVGCIVVSDPPFIKERKCYALCKPGSLYCPEVECE